MFWRSDIDSVITETKKLFDPGTSSGALLLVDAIDALDLPELKPLDKWNFPHERNSYLDACLERMGAFWQARGDLNDHLIPSIAPFYGAAEFSSFIGGQVRFEAETSWTEHSFCYEQINDLKCRKDGDMYKLLIGGIEYLSMRSAGQYAVRTRGIFSPLDLAYALRSSGLFTDFYDSPDELHRLLEKLAGIQKDWWKDQAEAAGGFEGGLLCGLGIWMPKGGIGHITEDASCLCSPEQYRRFGYPYTRSVVDCSSCVVCHIHPVGAHVFNDIAALPNCMVLDLYNDPNQSRGIEVFKTFADKAFSGKIVHFYPTRKELVDNLEFLRRHKSIIRYHSKDLHDAYEVCDIVRNTLYVR